MRFQMEKFSTSQIMFNKSSLIIVISLKYQSFPISLFSKMFSIPKMFCFLFSVLSNKIVDIKMKFPV